MAGRAQALPVSEPKCPACGQGLKLATSFYGSPSNVTAQFLWCSNESCMQFGVMTEVHSSTNV
jgi:hypothetical protein